MLRPLLFRELFAANTIFVYLINLGEQLNYQTSYGTQKRSSTWSMYRSIAQKWFNMGLGVALFQSSIDLYILPDRLVLFNNNLFQRIKANRKH